MHSLVEALSEAKKGRNFWQFWLSQPFPVPTAPTSWWPGQTTVWHTLLKCVRSRSTFFPPSSLCISRCLIQTKIFLRALSTQADLSHLSALWILGSQPRTQWISPCQQRPTAVNGLGFFGVCYLLRIHGSRLSNTDPVLWECPCALIQAATRVVMSSYGDHGQP